MRTLLVLGALVLSPAVLATADDRCPPSPVPPGPPAPSAPGEAFAPGAPNAPGGAFARGLHGGQILVVPDSNARFELLQDSNQGVVTLFAIPSGGPGAIPVTLSTPPVLVLSNGTEIRFEAVSGAPGTWQAKNDSLRVARLDGRLKLNLDGRESVVAIAPQAPGALPGQQPGAIPGQPPGAMPGAMPGETPAPGQPAGFAEPLASRGGIVLSTCGPAFEWVFDAQNRKGTLYAIKRPGERFLLDGPPTLVLAPTGGAAGARELAMTQVPGQENAWVVENLLTPPQGSIRLFLDGHSCDMPIQATAGLGQAFGPHGGLFLNLAPLGRVEVVHDPAIGKVTLWSTARFAPTDKATLVLDTPTGPRRLDLKTEADGSWSVTDPTLKNARLTGSIEGSIGGQNVRAPLPVLPPAQIPGAMPGAAPGAMPGTGPGAMPGMPTPGEKPGMMPPGAQPPGATAPGAAGGLPAGARTVVFGANEARVEIVHDAAKGRLTIRPLEPSADLSNPTLVLAAPGGPRTFTAKEEGSGVGRVWVVEDKALENPTLEGRLRIDVKGRQLEAPLERTAIPAAPGAPEAPGMPGTGAIPGQEPGAPAARAGVRTLVFGGGVARLDLRHDVADGRVTLSAPAGAAMPQIENPVLILDGPSGREELRFQKDASGTWSVTSKSLEKADLRGTVRIRLDGRDVDASLSEATAMPKPPGEIPPKEPGGGPTPPSGGGGYR